MTKAFHVNKVGKIIEVSFNSLEDAKMAKFPDGCVFAFLPIEDGFHVYSDTLGWEYYKK